MSDTSVEDAKNGAMSNTSYQPQQQQQPVVVYAAYAPRPPRPINPDRPGDCALICLAIFISPLAVYYYRGTCETDCLINLLLCLFSGCAIVPQVHAIMVVTGHCDN